MESYNLYKAIIGPTFISVQRQSDNASIPLVMANRDCVQFLADWKSGATVTNSDGSSAIYSDDAVRALGLEPLT